MIVTGCQRCNAPDDGDLRTLWMACFYDMTELRVPFEQRRVGPEGYPFFLLRVCKTCRAEWMTAIQQWFHVRPLRSSSGSGIFVRELGATIEISEEEWQRRNPGRDPVRVVPQGDR